MAHQNPLYSPIASQDGFTRVFELDPGSFNDHIKLRLRVVQLPAYSDYEALSYVWGTEVAPQTACVDDHELSITLNLDIALRHFRLKDTARTLWVDAVSINQRDIKERSLQVQLMREIYSSARAVIVWLGSLEDQQEQDALRWAEMDHIPESLDERTTLVLGLRKIHDRPWFTRVWVVQELALARDEPPMYLGKETVFWSNMLAYCNRFRRAQLKEDIRRRPRDAKGALLTFGSMYHDLHLGDVRNTSIQSALSTKMFFTRSLCSTDPRDKVFGILGLSSESALERMTGSVVADYSKPVQQVFSETMAKILHEDTLRAISTWPLQPLKSQHSDDATRVADLPSWVPDFSMRLAYAYDVETYLLPHDLAPGFDDIEDLFDIPGVVLPIATVSSNSSILHTAGVYIGSVAVTSSVYMPVPPANSGQMWLSAGTLNHIYTTYAEPRQIDSHMLFYTMLGRDMTVPDLCEVRDKAADWRPIADAKDTEEAHDLGWYAVSAPALHRTMFITEEGHVGLAYHPDVFNGIRVGDVVVGLYGLNIPYVLRQVGGGYQVINIAHVAGHEFGHEFFAEGEDGATWRDFEKFGLQEYALV